MSHGIYATMDRVPLPSPQAPLDLADCQAHRLTLPDGNDAVLSLGDLRNDPIHMLAPFPIHKTVKGASIRISPPGRR